MNGLGSPVSFWSSSGRCYVCLVSSRFLWPPESEVHIPAWLEYSLPSPALVSLSGILASHSCGLLQRSFHWPLISMLVLFVVSFVVEKSLILMLSNPSGFHFIVGVLKSSFPNHRTTWIVFYDFLYEVFNLFSLPLYVKARFQLYFSPSISY